MIAFEVAREGFLDRHVRLIREVYRERRNVMLQAMEETFPQAVQWTRPQGGLFLWATLPEGMKSADVLQDAIAEKVAFVPGSPFFSKGGGENTMRLNFSNATPAKIREGMARLGRVLQRRMIG
jgi:2-aminoadipate transaminase